MTNPRVALSVAVEDYKRWRVKGGLRGTDAGRRKREHIGELVEKVRREISDEETVTLDMESRNEIDPFEEAAR